MSLFIKLPRMFFADHRERDLPTPVVIKSNRTHVWVKTDDPAVDELLDDAKYYADSASGMAEECRGLCMSARATVKAIKEARA